MDKPSPPPEVEGLGSDFDRFYGHTTTDHSPHTPPQPKPKPVEDSESEGEDGLSPDPGR